MTAEPSLGMPGARVTTDPPAPLGELGVVTTRSTLAAAFQSMPDGTRVEFRADGTPNRRWNPDGSVVSFNQHGQPTVETTPDGTTFTLRPDGSRTELLVDGTVVELDASWRPAAPAEPDHIRFTRLDNRGRPLVGTLADGTAITYQYGPDGAVTIRYPSGLTQVLDIDGHLSWERTSDGTVFEAFDHEGRPVAGWSPGGQRLTITYNGKGQVVRQLDQGPEARPEPSARQLRAVPRQTPAFSAFDELGRPTRGSLPNGDQFTIRYDAQGRPNERRGNGQHTLQADRGDANLGMAPSGALSRPVGGDLRPPATAPTGAGLGLGIPPIGAAFEPADDSAGAQPPGPPLVTLVPPTGTTVADPGERGSPAPGTVPRMLFADPSGSRLPGPDGSTGDPDPSRTMSPVAPGGAAFTDPGDNNNAPRGAIPPMLLANPTAGPVPQSDAPTGGADPGGQPDPPITVDGTTFSGFDASGRPTQGVLSDGTVFNLSSDAQGNVVERRSDGTVIQTDSGGQVISDVTPDGTTLAGFDSQGRPTQGTLPDGTPFTLSYDGAGDTFEHSADGSTVEVDGNGRVIATWTPEGTQITWSVDIAALGDATSRVAGEKDAMAGEITALKGTFTTIEGMWQGPAGATLPPLVADFTRVTDSLMTLLEDAISRMRVAHQNYVDTENTNVGNLQ
jgi:YD repeat-containing protein